MMNSKKGNTRTTWLIILILYLTAVTLFMGFIGTTFGDTGTETGDVGPSFLRNLVTGISILPLWLNIIMFTIPVGILVYILFVNSTPTTNAGA